MAFAFFCAKESNAYLDIEYLVEISSWPSQKCAIWLVTREPELGHRERKMKQKKKKNETEQNAKIGQTNCMSSFRRCNLGSMH